MNDAKQAPLLHSPPSPPPPCNAVPARHMQPEQRGLQLLCSSPGRANALAFWFELQLTEEEEGGVGAQAASEERGREAAAAAAVAGVAWGGAAAGSRTVNRISTGPLEACATGSRTWQVRMGAPRGWLREGRRVFCLLTPGVEGSWP